MATTIQISDNTKQLLERLKEEQSAPNYDQVIQQLIQQKINVPKSLFGSVKIKWNKTDRMEFREL